MSKVKATIQTYVSLGIKWWNDRQPRERLLLAVCCCILFVYAIYGLINIYRITIEDMKKELQNSQEELIWVSDKYLDMIELKDKGSIYLESNVQLEQIILSAVNKLNIDNEVSLTFNNPNWVFEWSGSNPSKAMNALNIIYNSGANIDSFSFKRNNANSNISATINY